MCAVDLLRQLQHPVPPLPFETRSDVYLTPVLGSGVSSKSDALHARLIEPVSPPPRESQVPGEIDCVVKSSESSKFDVHLHVSLDHSCAEILKQTA